MTVPSVNLRHRCEHILEILWTYTMLCFVNNWTLSVFCSLFECHPFELSEHLLKCVVYLWYHEYPCCSFLKEKTVSECLGCTLNSWTIDYVRQYVPIEITLSLVASGRCFFILHWYISSSLFSVNLERFSQLSKKVHWNLKCLHHAIIITPFVNLYEIRI